MWKETSSNKAGLLVLPSRIGEFICVPPHNEKETLDPHKLSTTGTKLLSTLFAKWSNVIIYTYIIYTYIICTYIYIYIHSIIYHMYAVHFKWVVKPHAMKKRPHFLEVESESHRISLKIPVKYWVSLFFPILFHQIFWVLAGPAPHRVGPPQGCWARRRSRRRRRPRSRGPPPGRTLC